MDNQNYETKTTQQGLTSIGELFSRAWQVYKERFWTLMGIGFFLLIGSIIVVAGLMIGGSFLITFLSGGDKMILILSTIVAFIMILFLQIFPVLSLMFAVKRRKQKIGIRSSLAKAWYRLHSFIWINLLTGLVPLLMMLPFLIGVFLINLSVGAILGFISMPITLLLVIWFSLSPYVLVGEDVRGIKALLRSKELVQGNSWGVFVRLFLIGIIMNIIVWVLGVIPYGGMLAFLILPFPIVYIYLIYEDLSGDINTEELQQPEL